MMTTNQLQFDGRNEKKEFMKRWGHWPCSVFEFNLVSLFCVKIYFTERGTKEIVTLLKQQLELDYEIFDIEQNFVHFHCLYESVHLDGRELLETKISDLLRDFETYELHWIG
ncbi:hypothetical protein MHB75_09225 [Kurthia sp. FSL E2-0154]|uniref:hypothetical protein n=1 Tax=Kurthia sp. FSL E2-0154 TaxID=2921358 RepID=UPI0030FCE1C9